MKTRETAPQIARHSQSAAEPRARIQDPLPAPSNPRQFMQHRQIAQLAAAAQRVPVNDDVALEREADQMGAHAAQRGRSDSPRSAHPSTQRASEAGLPASLRNGIESLSGLDMSGVKVHRNSAKPAQLNAHAYAQGRDIHLGPGQEKHLPHEAWHIVQQAQGRVRATMQMKLMPANGAWSDYAAAFSALRPVAHDQADTSKPPAQLMLTGDYAAAGLVIIGYSRDSYSNTWESRLQEAQDAGFAAPRLVGHLSQSSGKDGKGEKDRQKQNNKLLATWWAEFQKSKSKRKDDDEDDDAASGAATTSSGLRSESHREEYKEQRRTEKREQYRESQKEAPYVPPWHGGPSAWTSNRTD